MFIFCDEFRTICWRAWRETSIQPELGLTASPAKGQRQNFGEVELH
jgi:hypothetical protein